MSNPPILTSSSRYKAFLKCPRLGYWQYEHLNSDGSRGLERKKLDLPLSTGGWCHKVAQGLLWASLKGWAGAVAAEGQWQPATRSETILGPVTAYRREIADRGMELGLSLDGAIEEEKFLERTIAEQAALIEAFGWAFARVRLPRLLEEYDLLDVEREEFTLLSGDVGLQSRCDAVLRRKQDQRLFIYNLKTSGSPDRKWKESWEYDQQLMTETLAVERRLGERVYGVIVDGFDKGQRVQCWWDGLREIREGSSKPPYEGALKWQKQRSRLLYGYKCEETIPGRPPMYDFEGTTRKGWGPFAVWENADSAWSATGLTLVEYWLNWLPIEQVEASFVTLLPIMRLEEQVQAKVRQMVQVELEIRAKRQTYEQCLAEPSIAKLTLDDVFPQHDGYNCLSCSMKRLCWETGASADPSSAGYQPRTANHPEVE